VANNFDWSKIFELARADRVQSATVSFMITRAQRARLRELGYSDEAISTMTPEEAHRILDQQWLI